MNDIESKFANVFNLSDYEAKLYIATQGDSVSISDMADRTGIPRTAVYPPLKSLVSKGFITALREKGKRTKYRAIEPKYLKQIFSQKLTELDDVVEQLGSTISSDTNQVYIRYFEGHDGLKIANDILLHEAKAKIWKTFEDPLIVEKLVGSKYFENYIKARTEKGMSARCIIPAREHSTWMNRILNKTEEYRLEIRLVSPEEYPLRATIVVAGEWILCMVARPQKPFALLIQNPLLASTFESIHDMVWERFSTH